METYEKDANTQLEELPKDKAGTIWGNKQTDSNPENKPLSPYWLYWVELCPLKFMSIVAIVWSDSFATLWSVACQGPVNGISQGRILELPFPSSRDLPNLGIEPRSPALQANFLRSGKPHKKQEKTGKLTQIKGCLRSYDD